MSPCDVRHASDAFTHYAASITRADILANVSKFNNFKIHLITSSLKLPTTLASSI